ncbi:hypothetical protein TNCV_2765071 [Trichonephila clavipes]|nr:hypothetical protein TNCV_2765071 [Trichonephila clavipes]
MNASIVKKHDLVVLERGMNEGARSVGIIIDKTAALVKCLRATFINVYIEWISKLKSGSQRQACGHYKLLEILSERRIAKVVQSRGRATVLQS